MTQRIRNLSDLKNFFAHLDRPILGIGVTAFNRLGLEEIIPNYQIICLRYSQDTQLIEKDLPVLSLEKEIAPEHLLGKRNSTTVLSHRKTQAYLKSFKKKPALVFYKVSSKIEKICQKNGWTMIANPKRFGKESLENKIKFRKIQEQCGITPIPAQITSFSKLNFKDSVRIYGLPFVIQHPTKGGGKGTFFIKNEEDFKRLKEKAHKFKENKVILAKFIKGPSPSLTGCVLRQGIVCTNLQYQLLDIPQLFNLKKGSGLFCGHDWSSSSFPKEISTQAYSIAEKLGRYFQKIGYLGIFGLDFVLDEKAGKLYVTECNPRLLGSFPVLPMVQIRNNEVPLLALHVLEFLKADYQIDLREINQQVQQKKTGAQMILHNLEGKRTKNFKELKAGVYKISNIKKARPSLLFSAKAYQRSKINLKFIRPGYSLKHLKTEDEFLITDGVPFLKTRFSSNERLLRILTLGRVLENCHSLTPKAQNIIKGVYLSLDLRP